VASWGDGEAEVFAIREDGALWDRYWDGARWHDWESLGGVFVGHPAACALDADRIDVFAVGTDGVLRHRYWDGSRWVEWTEVSEAPRDANAVACGWSGNRLDLFARVADGELWYCALEG
jgi:hypothetical protein